MKHRIKKIKFKKGKDATKAILRKLALNFIKYGKIETTLPRAKILKSLVDRLVIRAKAKAESTRNFLFKYLGEKNTIEKLLNVIAPAFSERKTGFVKITKLLPRLGDGAAMAKVEWVKPIIEIKNKKISPKAEKIRNQKHKMKIEKS